MIHSLYGLPGLSGHFKLVWQRLTETPHTKVSTINSNTIDINVTLVVVNVQCLKSIHRGPQIEFKCSLESRFSVIQVEVLSSQFSAQVLNILHYDRVATTLPVAKMLHQSQTRSVFYTTLVSNVKKK